MQLPSVKDLPVAGKKVLLRTDFDIPLRFAQGKPLIADKNRIEKSLPTIKYLLKQKAQIIIISHLGRPGGKVVPELSLEPVSGYLDKLLPGVKNYQLLENLRFDPGEESNNLNFAKKLASLADFFVNEAFAVSHRKHASIVGIPKYLPSAFGFHFLEEVENLSKVKDKPARPITLILGGAKEDKLAGINKLAAWADNVLIGGKLPLVMQNDRPKIKIAELNSENKDINNKSIDDFKNIIKQSAVVVWAGPMGVYEEEKNAIGTHEIAQAIIDSGAYSMVGGGDTQAALTKFGFDGKMGYISTGGGAMLEYLANGTLPGISAIINK